MSNNKRNNSKQKPQPRSNKYASPQKRQTKNHHSQKSSKNTPGTFARNTLASSSSSSSMSSPRSRSSVKIPHSLISWASSPQCESVLHEINNAVHVEVRSLFFHKAHKLQEKKETGKLSLSSSRCSFNSFFHNERKRTMFKFKIFLFLFSRFFSTLTLTLNPNPSACWCVALLRMTLSSSSQHQIHKKYV